MAIFDHAHPNILNQLLAFLNLYQYAKNQFIPPAHFWDTVNFRVQVTRLVTPIFDHAHTKHFWSTFNFGKSVRTCKKSIYSICSFFRYCQFLSPVTRLITTKLTLKIFNRLLICVNVSACKESVNSICSFWRCNFRVQRPDWSHPFFTMHKQKKFPINF